MTPEQFHSSYGPLDQIELRKALDQIRTVVLDGQESAVHKWTLILGIMTQTLQTAGMTLKIGQSD